jgi:hypothetical protein
MPGQQCRRGHKERPPALTVQNTGQTSEDRTVAVVEPRSRDLAVQDLELLAQHEDLNIFGPVAPTAQHKQRQDPAE